MTKRRNPRRVNRPDAFGKSYPKIKKLSDADAKAMSKNAELNGASVFKMGKLYIEVCPPTETQEYVMSVNHPHRLPTWNEMVWLRYNLLPDDRDVALILPPLKYYINYDGGRAQNTMTMQTVIPDAKERIGLMLHEFSETIREATDR